MRLIGGIEEIDLEIGPDLNVLQSALGAGVGGAVGKPYPSNFTVLNLLHIFSYTT
jgi:hypothetical protein